MADSLSTSRSLGDSSSVASAGPPDENPSTIQADLAWVATAIERVRRELAKVVIGQSVVVDQLLLGLLCRGHCLIEGVPGLAKTLLVASLARTLSLSFSRVQFTPDLMPADITGTEVIQEDRTLGSRELRFVRGPIFANIVLADEINRTPPKTQSALLEAMAEGQVTVGGVRHTLPAPFFVLATQNPIEQEGTYPLPEAQLDRFLFLVRVDYPSEDEEVAIVTATTAGRPAPLLEVLTGAEVLRLQDLVIAVAAPEAVVRYATTLVRATRPGQTGTPDWVARQVAWGAGPRASQFLILAAKARALLAGRTFIGIEDVRTVAPAVLRHRVICTFNAQAEGLSTDKVVARLLNDIAPTSRSGESPQLDPLLR